MEQNGVRFVRVETAAQIEETAALAAVIWQECFAKLLGAAQIAHMVQKFQSAPAMTQQIEQEGYEYYQLYFDGGDTPGGYIAVQPENGKLLLSKFYFLAQHRGHGHGRTALDFVEQLGRKRGCSAVWLTVNRHNERAIAVYRQTGFAQTREQVVDIGGGFVMDDFIFEKTL